MSALSCNLRALGSLVGLVCLVSAFNIQATAAAPVGKVTQVQNPAQIGSAPAVVGAPVNLNDRLRTGAKARLEVTFSDQSKLTLGENANVVINHFVYNPSQSKGEVVLNATQGALRFAGGKIENMQQKKMLVNTPSAALAVRGTHFWAGPIDGKYGVLLLNGKLNVSNQGGAVNLTRPGQGIDLANRRRRH